MISQSTFKPAWWLPGPHLQTMYPTLLRRVKAPVTRWESVELPDGDFLELAWADAGLAPDAPLVLLLHGLGGSVKSPYAAGMMHALNRAGWRAVLMHFRGAGRAPNRLLRAYHSGETQDLDTIVHMLRAREPDTLMAAVGVSLGGNVLMKWLGEQGSAAPLAGAVAISVPYVLRLVASRMERGIHQIYQSWLLTKLRRDVARKVVSHPREMEAIAKRLATANCFWTFDDAFTAPVHGFSNVHNYYREASSRPYLSRVRVPTLLLHALDDPFMFPDVLPGADELSPSVTLELSEHGGHVGFVSGRLPGKPVYWLETRVPAFLKDCFHVPQNATL